MPRSAGPETLLERPGLTIVQGDPLGPLRDVLAQAMAAAVAAGTPAVAVLTDETAPQYRARLQALGVDVAGAEEEGRLFYVDACGPAVGWAHTTPGTVFVEHGGADGILMALSEVQAVIVESAPHHLVIVDSMSTFTLLHGLQQAFTLGLTLKSFGDRLGASVVLGMTRGMHADESIVPLVHLADALLTAGRDGTLDPPAPRRPDALRRQD